MVNQLPVQSPIDEKNCGNCRRWWPKSTVLLELKGTCFLDPDKPVFKTRYGHCSHGQEGFKGIQNEQNQD